MKRWLPWAASSFDWHRANTIAAGYEAQVITLNEHIDRLRFDVIQAREAEGKCWQLVDWPKIIENQ